jgi:hypothetical protein
MILAVAGGFFFLRTNTALKTLHGILSIVTKSRVATIMEVLAMLCENESLETLP